jgi:hypothetical protein
VRIVVQIALLMTAVGARRPVALLDDNAFAPLALAGLLKNADFSPLT